MQRAEVAMRAAFYNEFGEVEKVQVGDQPEPTPRPGDVLVRNRAASLGFWDVKKLRGIFGSARFPVVPGFEVAGTVVQGGEQAGFAAGERVFGSLETRGGGACAELSVAPADHLVRIPEEVDFARAAALVISAGTAYEGLIDRAHLRAGESVLITAASGGVGSAAAQIAAAVGARVIAVASAGNREYLTQLGAERVVDYRDPGFVEQLREAAPRGYDVLFDATGNEVAEQAVALVRSGGRALFIAGRVPERADIDAGSFSAKVNADRLTGLNRFVREGTLSVHIDAEYPLDRTADAIAHVAGRHTRGKVVVDIG